jgi:hypothetical protein
LNCAWFLLDVFVLCFSTFSAGRHRHDLS